MNEKIIDGFDGRYSISTTGILRNVATGRILKPGISGGGYLHANLYKDGKSTGVKIHKLVAIYFIENIENKNCINHKDGNKQNNNIDNLEWCTHSENTKHAYKIGLLKPCHKMAGVPKPHMIGSLNHKAKLTESDVRSIRNSTKSRSELAKQYNVSWTIINLLLKRKTWRHIK